MKPHWLVPALVGGAIAAAYRLLMSPVSQLVGSFPFRGDLPDKVIALTFDDGPNEPYTSQIADFLATENIRGTFFQVGICINRFPDMPAALLRQGHVIGNHSYSHRMLRCIRPAAQRTETLTTQTILTSAIGRIPALYRPPWLLRTPSLYSVLRSHNLQPVSGTFCHPLEVLQPTPERIAARALKKAKPGAILIFHDGFDSRVGHRGHTVFAVKLVVAELQSAGYRFVTVDEMLGVNAYSTL